MDNLLEVKNLKKYFPIKGGFFRTVVGNVKAVDDVSFVLQKGKTLGVVGESGCGKSTLGRAILRLHEPTDGQVVFEGKDITQLSHEEMVAMRREMQIIFQDPFASLNPRLTVFQIIVEPLEIHDIGTPEERYDKVCSLMDLVGLRRQYMHRYPHEFSGGQRQRIGIARALTMNPKFIVADEPVSALDVSVQSQVLNLIRKLQQEFGISFLFIAHDLAVVQHICDHVAVMYLGRMVEKAKAEDLYKSPKHPYTQALLSAIPQPDPNRNIDRIVLEGDVPSPINPPSGCPFHNRCIHVKEICKAVVPPVINTGTAENEHIVRCHLFSEEEQAKSKAESETTS